MHTTDKQNKETFLLNLKTTKQLWSSWHGQSDSRLAEYQGRRDILSRCLLVNFKYKKYNGEFSESLSSTLCHFIQKVMFKYLLILEVNILEGHFIFLFFCNNDCIFIFRTVGTL